MRRLQSAILLCLVTIAIGCGFVAGAFLFLAALGFAGEHFGVIGVLFAVIIFLGVVFGIVDFLGPDRDRYLNL